MNFVEIHKKVAINRVYDCTYYKIIPISQRIVLFGHRRKRNAALPPLPRYYWPLDHAVVCSRGSWTRSRVRSVTLKCHNSHPCTTRNVLAFADTERAENFKGRISRMNRRGKWDRNDLISAQSYACLRCCLALIALSCLMQCASKCIRENTFN